jgi:hypothetical protein
MHRCIPGEEKWPIPGKTGQFLEKPGYFWEIGAEGDRAPAGTWCSRGRSADPRAAAFAPVSRSPVSQARLRGLIRRESNKARSITTTADAESTSRISTVTSLKSSPARMAAADGIHEARGETRPLRSPDKANGSRECAPDDRLHPG